MTEEQRAMLEPYVAPPEAPNAISVVDMITEDDRELAKMVINGKRHLGPLSMIEVGIVLGRILEGAKQ